MKNSPRNKDDSQSLAPTPSSSIITVTRITSANRPYITRSETATVFRANSSSFRQIVQRLTGPCMNRYSTDQPAPSLRYLLPPLRTVPTKKHSSSSSSSSSTIYERRNRLKINPVCTGLTGNIPLSSPDTPLVHDPFSRSGSVTPSLRASESGDSDVEEREIREKGFYLHPSPSSTPTDPEPQLLVLFPLTSPRASDSPASST